MMKTLIFEEQVVGELCNELLALHFHIRGEPKESGDQDVKYEQVLIDAQLDALSLSSSRLS